MNIVVYFFQVSACTGIFYLFYYLLLRRLTFFTINRWYLLATILLSFAIPAIKLPVSQQQQYIPVVQQAIYINTLQSLPQAVVPVLKNIPVPASYFNWIVLLKATYFVITAALASHLLISIILLLKRLNRQKGTKINNAVILKCDKKLVNGSFLNYIFLDDSNLSAIEQQQVIAHEMLHIKLRHSVDRIVVTLAKVILWFNPFVYLYAKAMEENHEFEVDREMALSSDKNDYANLLLSLAVNGQSVFCHNFSKAPLKKRIKMLFTKSSNNMKKAIYVLIVPVVSISCLAFARLKSDDATNPKVGQRQTEKYRQDAKADGDAQAKNEDYRQTDDFKAKTKALNEVFRKELTFTVKDVLKEGQTGKNKGFTVVYNNAEFEMRTNYGQEKQLNNLLNAGDKIRMKIFGASYGKNTPIIVGPAYIFKNDVKIFQLVEADKLPNYPFLYESNKVRFADGQVTDIKTYPDGKWKSARFETVNGYKFNLSFKPTAPDLSTVVSGDHVRLRFVHELKEGSKEYLVNDWVSISTDEKGYGIKNPDLFGRFYSTI